jgi:hypothetical protein
MHRKTEQRIAAQTAKALAMMCVRNTSLEDIHAGISPVSKTCDYSDVRVIDGEGREIPWTELSRISDEEMRQLMKQVVNRLYTWFVKTEDLAFHARLQSWLQGIQRWDEPELDAVFTKMVEGGDAASGTPSTSQTS